MTKRKAKVPDDNPLLVFKTAKQKKYFILMLFDFVLLLFIVSMCKSILLMVVVSGALSYLLLKHFKEYHLAIKEGGGIS